MRLIRLAVLVLVLIALSTNTFAADVAHNMAIVNAGRNIPKDDPSVRRFGYLLSLLDQCFGETQVEVGDMTVTSWEILRKDKLATPLIDIFEGMVTVCGQRLAGERYDCVISLYTTLRQGGATHKEVVEMMTDSIQVIGVDGVFSALGLECD